MENKVLAKVENKEITEEIVNKFINDLGPQAGMQFNNPEGRKRVVEELVNQELAYLDAMEKGMDKDEEFVKQFEMMREGLLKQYAIGKLLSDLEVTDKDAEEYYNEHPEYFKQPEKLNANHILVETEEKANEIKEKIENGLSFEDAAKEFSTCPSNQAGGSLGEFERGQMVPEFEKVAFELPVDKVSDPVKTDFGYHIILVKGKKEEGTMPFAEVKEDLKNQLLAVKQQEKYVNETNKLKDKYKVEINL